MSEQDPFQPSKKGNRRLVVAGAVAAIALTAGIKQGVDTAFSSQANATPEATFTFTDQARSPYDTLDKAAIRIAAESGAPVEVVKDNLTETVDHNDGIRTNPNDGVFQYDAQKQVGEPVEAKIPQSDVTFTPPDQRPQP